MYWRQSLFAQFAFVVFEVFSVALGAYAGPGATEQHFDHIIENGAVAQPLEVDDTCFMVVAAFDHKGIGDESDHFGNKTFPLNITTL